MDHIPLILVADDEELVVDLVCAALEPLECMVETLDDGLAVIDVVTARRPDLVILDCSMPGLSGVDAVRQIRAADEGFTTPVLMLTGRRAAADEAIAKRAGANYYMRKPFAAADLLARVEFILAETAERAGREFTPKATKVVESPSRRSINLA
jgi:DNA-binding response OmpR family regulator